MRQSVALPRTLGAHAVPPLPDEALRPRCHTSPEPRRELGWVPGGHDPGQRRTIHCDPSDCHPRSDRTTPSRRSLARFVTTGRRGGAGRCGRTVCRFACARTTPDRHHSYGSTRTTPGRSQRNAGAAFVWTHRRGLRARDEPDRRASELPGLRTAASRSPHSGELPAMRDWRCSVSARRVPDALSMGCRLLGRIVLPQVIERVD